MKKVLSVITIVLICAAVFLCNALALLHLIDKLAYRSFYSNAEVAFATPGVNDGFVQQGLDYVEEDKIFLVAGYTSNGTASRVYVVDERGNAAYTELKNADGSDYLGHTGGIARNGEFVYITADDGLDVFAYADVVGDAASAKKLGEVPTYNDPAYCYIHNGYLLAGSFYIEGTYETPERERVTTPNGDRNTSAINVFKLDGSKEFGIDPIPRAVISTGGLVQGMCVTEKGKVVLSTSYGLRSSQLIIYDTSDLPKEENYRLAGTTEDGETFAFEGLTRYYLDGGSLAETVKAPPMSEEIVYRNGKIYIMNESACNKYIFGKFTSGRNIYAYSYAE